MDKYPNFGTLDMIASNNVPNAVPATIAASGNWTSGAIIQVMNPVILAAVTSDQVGNLTIQKYADKAATIAVGNPVTQAITASVTAWATDNDTVPYLSFTVTVTNTSVTTANISNLAILTSSAGGI